MQSLKPSYGIHQQKKENLIKTHRLSYRKKLYDFLDFRNFFLRICK